MLSRLIVDLRTGLNAILFVLLAVLTAHGQDANSDANAADQPQGNEPVGRPAEPHPLQPADTSSPRDTLRGFMTDSRRLLTDGVQSGRLANAAAYQAYSHCVARLDFSTTPRGNAPSIQSRRLLMLREILDRLEIPDDTEIPGDDEIAQREVTRWRIPQTSIAIERIETGRRKGEYLFSASTVERLDQFYRMAKHLPYQPGAIEGVYEEYLEANNSSRYREEQVRNRLRPVDLSNPRSTLLGFLDSVNRTYALVMKADAARRADPPTMTIAEVQEVEVTAQNLLQRAIATLDLSQIPQASRESVGIECTLQLKEILDRINPPAIEFVPDAAMVEIERERLRNTTAGGALPVRWRIPSTTLEIVEVLEGEHKGSFRFSADTVSRLDSQFAAVRQLPYRTDLSEIVLEYPSPEVSEGFYEYYISTPGSLIPHATPLGRLVDSLPESLKSVHYGQTVWQWGLLLLCLLLITILSGLIWLVSRFVVRRTDSPWDQWLRLVAPIVLTGVILGSIDFLANDLNLTGQVLSAVSTSGNFIVIFITGYIAFRLCHAIADTVIALPQVPDASINASLLRLSSGMIGTLLFAWILVTGLSNLGIDMIPLLAGLGVGGLAIALAARPTMESIIGSFMIFWDSPYEVGQRIKVLGHDGVVESIGLRSTKIRLLTGHLTSIPNEKMASVEIENIGRRPYIRRVLNVTVTYDTPPDKIKLAMEILKEVLAVPETEMETPEGKLRSAEEDEQKEPHPNDAINQPDFPPRIFFNDLNADSLNILVIYWYHPAEYWDYLQHATWINMQIMERFVAEGIDFAFPTQTLHLAGDENRPLTVGQRWESEESHFTPNAMVAQAAAFGAQTVLAQQSPASESLRPEAMSKDEPARSVEGELTDAPIEDAVMHGDDDGDGDDAGQR